MLFYMASGELIVEQYFLYQQGILQKIVELNHNRGNLYEDY